MTDQNGASDYIFPIFAEYVLDDEKETVESRVCKLFSSCYSALLKVIEEYIDKIDGEVDVDLFVLQSFIL